MMPSLSAAPPAPVGALGKLPSHDEFIRIRAGGEPFATFDAWMVDNFAWANARPNPAWDEAYRQGDVQAFVFRAPGAGPSDPLLVGALGPSADRAGRLFPLAIVAPLEPSPALLACPTALPIVLEDFWTVASDLILAASPLSLGELEVSVAAKRAFFDADPHEALAPYRQWSSSLAVADLFLLMLGDEVTQSVAEGALRWFFEAVRPHQRVERSHTPLTLRVPLGRAGGAAVCFWLDMAQRFAGWQSTLPSFFWSHDGERGTMLLHLGDPPKVTLSELWMSTPSRNEVCDLTTPVRPEQLEVCAPLAASLASMLGDATCSLATFLEGITPSV